jgi:hypothetical protein
VSLARNTLEFFFPGAAVRRAMKRPASFSITDFPRDRIGKIAGPVRSIDDADVAAPIPDRRCVAYHIRVTMTATDDVGWYPIISTSVGVPFAIEDDSGMAHVFPDGANWDLDNEFDSLRGANEQQAEMTQALLLAHGIGFLAWRDTRQLRMVDDRGAPRRVRVVIGLLEVGEFAAVAGRGIREPLLDHRREAGYRQGPSSVLMFRAHRRAPLYISNSAKAARWTAGGSVG